MSGSRLRRHKGSGVLRYRSGEPPNGQARALGEYGSLVPIQETREQPKVLLCSHVTPKASVWSPRVLSLWGSLRSRCQEAGPCSPRLQSSCVCPSLLPGPSLCHSKSLCTAPTPSPTFFVSTLRTTVSWRDGEGKQRKTLKQQESGGERVAPLKPLLCSTSKFR